MKCNIKNNSNNGMARAFGEEFNLSHEEIINIIKKIYKLEKNDTTFRHEDVEVALYNSDYYIRPGKEKAEFMMKFLEISNRIKEDLKEMPEWIVHWRCSLDVIELIKQSFDEAYFKEQVERRCSASSVVNKDKLNTYMKKFDEDQLEAFMTIIIAYRFQNGMFVSNPSSVAFWKGMDDACRDLGYDVPFELDSASGKEFLKTRHQYYFKYLSKKTIATMLCEAIDLDVELAGSVAKKLYNCGYEATLNYLNVKLSCKG